jgi:hypothetical protein
MQDIAELTTPCIREIILTPIEAAGATDIPLRDESGCIIMTETGLPVYEA